MACVWRVYLGWRQAGDAAPNPSLKKPNKQKQKVDSGLTAELITPHLRGELGIASSNRRLETGLGAGGSVSGAELVTLQGGGTAVFF